MADQKISEQTSGGAAQSTDEVPVARSGTNRKLTIAAITAAAVAAVGLSVGQVAHVVRSAADCTVAYVDGTETIDASTAGKCRLTNDLDGNTVLTFSSAANGLDGRVTVRQDGVGSHTLSAVFTDATTVFLGGDIDPDADAYGYLGWDCATTDSNLTCFYWLAPEEEAAGGGNTTTVQTEIPIETDDTGDGYTVGDRVCSTAAGACWIALDVSTGAAVWRRDTSAVSNRSIYLIKPYVSSNVEHVGLDGVATSGTIDTPTISSSSYRESRRRTNASDTGGSITDIRTMDVFWRGNAAGLGGFYVEWTYAIASSVSGQMSACGLYDGVGEFSGFDPLGDTNFVSIGNADADTTLQVMSNDGTSTGAKTSLGASYPSNNTAAVYRVILYAAASASTIYYVVDRVDTATVSVRGSLSSNLPVNTAFLKFWCGMWDASADDVSFDLMQFYGEGQ